MDVTKAFWGELERSESDPQKAVGKCAGKQMPLANALASKCRWQMRWKSASGGCKLASAVGCRLSAVSWRASGVGRL